MGLGLQDVTFLSAITPLFFIVIGPGKLLWRLSPWELLFFSHGCLSRLRDNFPGYASFSVLFLMQPGELSINNQFQHPHAAFLGCYALCYFKDLCKHIVKKENVEKAFMIRKGGSQKRCTFPKKPHCGEDFRACDTLLWLISVQDFKFGLKFPH